MRRLASVALVLALLTGGCLTGTSGNASDEPSSERSEPTSPAPNPDETNASIQNGPLSSAPGWLPGEYWTVRLESTLFEEPVTWTRVVAGFTSDGYLVGQPADDFSLPGLLFHVPGLGGVTPSNLSYSVHGANFQPVEFPLDEGTEWQTTFEGDPVNATTSVREDGTAHIEFCCKRNITATYDPDVRAISELDVDDGFLHYEVTDHGYAHQGPVDVPLNRSLVFFTGRAAGLFGASQPVGGPTDSVEVPKGVETVAFTQIVGNIDPSPTVGTGVYEERAVHPNGTTFTTRQSVDADGLELGFHQAGNASGAWTFEHVAAGPGIAFTEGIGYELERVRVG